MTEAELLAQPAEAYMNADQQAFFRDLLLRPTTTLSIEAKQRQEQREKHQRSA